MWGISVKLTHTHLSKHKTRVLRFEKIRSSVYFDYFFSVRCSVNTVHGPRRWIFLGTSAIIINKHICRLVWSTRVAFLLFYSSAAWKILSIIFRIVNTNHKGSHQPPIQTFIEYCTTGYCFDFFFFFLIQGNNFQTHIYYCGNICEFFNHLTTKKSEFTHSHCHTSIYENLTFHSK